MKKIFITLTAAAISFNTFAQSELSGFWTLQNKESISGKLYSNGAPETVKFSMDGNNLAIEKSTAAGDGTFSKSNEVVSLDKPAETTTASKRKKVITLKKDGSTYVEYAVLYNAADATKADHKVTDVWSIENGQLVLDRKDENLVNGETWELKAAYSKQ